MSFSLAKNRPSGGDIKAASSSARRSFFAHKQLAKLFVGVFALAVVISFSVLWLSRVFAVPTEPVPVIELTSQQSNYAESEAGSWHIKKLAGWTDRNKVRIAYDVDSKMKLNNDASDVILVIDNASSYIGESIKFNLLKDALSRLVEELVGAGDNRLALVTFAANYKIISNFTNNQDTLLLNIDTMEALGEKTNYYQGLNGAEKLLQQYDNPANRDTIILFVTDGAPEEETLYQHAEYRLLKYKYPNITINAVQYDMGDATNEELASVSDAQFIANTKNITDAVFDAASAPNSFTEFILTDFMEDRYFTISADSIRTDKGSFSLEYDGDTPKLIWDLSGELRSGYTAHLELDLELKPSYHNTPGLYSVAKRTDVRSILPSVPNENITTTNTPVLKTDYAVSYLANSPDGCTAQGVPASTETHFIYSTVEISSTTPTCTGYNFAGYEILQDGVTRLNGDYFRMPDKDVTLSATWTKLDLEKKIDGEVFVAKTLYDTIAQKSIDAGGGSYHLDDYIDFGQNAVGNNGVGVHTIANTANDEYPIHYFRGSVGNTNNVLFAGICWRAMRTTDTGGVKLVYAGEASLDRKCGGQRKQNFHYGSPQTLNLADNYYYGTDFIWNHETETFSLVDQKLLSWTQETQDSMVGLYTCYSAEVDTSCSKLYYVFEFQTNGKAYVMPMSSAYGIIANGNVQNYSLIGGSPINIRTDSLAHIGYMYGDPIPSNRTTTTWSSAFYAERTVIAQSKIENNFYFADSISYSAESKKYSLIDPYRPTSTEDYPNLVGKYTFRASQEDYTNNVAYYVIGVKDSIMYWLQMSNGQTREDIDTDFYAGDDFVDNGDDTYTLVNPIRIKKSEYDDRYAEFAGKYTCGADKSYTCNYPDYMVQTGILGYGAIGVRSAFRVAKQRDGYELVDSIIAYPYQISQHPEDYAEYKYTCNFSNATTCEPENLKMVVKWDKTLRRWANNIIWGNDVSWDGENYTLIDTISLEDYNDLDKISTHHYICLKDGQTSCDKVSYVYSYYGDSGGRESYATYITLENGETDPLVLLQKMFQNKTDSTKKIQVDAWFKHRLLSYMPLIEDTVYCNDRSIANPGKWDPNGGRADQALSYGAEGRISKNTPSLECSKTDSFTVSPAKGNGALTYPVGMLTADELYMAGHRRDNYGPLWTQFVDGWTMSPSHDRSAYLSNSRIRGDLGISGQYGTVPVIPVAPGILISSGKGTTSQPWILNDYIDGRN